MHINYIIIIIMQRFWPEIEADEKGLSKPHRQHKLTEEREEEEEDYNVASSGHHQLRIL